MKRHQNLLVVVLMGALSCAALTGCTVGGISVMESFEDEDGRQRFMVLGERGETESTENLSGESALPAIESVVDEMELPDEGSISAISLKKGWDTSDNSIFRGIGVSVSSDCELLEVNISREKAVGVSYDIVLESGEYQLVYINPDSEEQILQESSTIKGEEKIIFPSGSNKIVLVSGNAVFEKIDIRVEGIDVSDF